ncbi:MAG: hypothetical protein AAFQ58_11085 [Pseudomonadota bacterium]
MDNNYSIELVSTPQRFNNGHAGVHVVDEVGNVVASIHGGPAKGYGSFGHGFPNSVYQDSTPLVVNIGGENYTLGDQGYTPEHRHTLVSGLTFEDAIAMLDDAGQSARDLFGDNTQYQAAYIPGDLSIYERLTGIALAGDPHALYQNSNSVAYVVVKAIEFFATYVYETGVVEPVDWENWPVNLPGYLGGWYGELQQVGLSVENLPFGTGIPFSYTSTSSVIQLGDLSRYSEEVLEGIIQSLPQNAVLTRTVFVHHNGEVHETGVIDYSGGYDRIEVVLDANDNVVSRRYVLGDQNRNENGSYSAPRTESGGWGGPSDSTGSGGRSSEGGNGWSTHDGRPIIIDLDRDGIEITIEKNVLFDWDNDDFVEQGSWVSADDGLLVLDLNVDGSRGAGDGIIDQTHELVWSLWGDEGDTDLQALGRAFDDNGDDVIDTNDGVWSELRIWQDLDQDGETDDGELRSLAHWGITQINVFYDDGSTFENVDDDITLFGNTLHGLASFRHNGSAIHTDEDVSADEDGLYTASTGVGDISLSYNSLGWRRIETDVGYDIQFETGEELRYAVITTDTAPNINLDDFVLDGATGDDRSNHLNATWHSRSVQIDGSAGDDSVWGGNADDFIAGGTGSDDIRGHGGNDLLFVDAADFTRHVDGNEGIDTLVVNDTANVSIILQSHNVEAVYSGAGNDFLSGADLWHDLPISGGDGDDTILGGLSSDNLQGGAGNDSISADYGSDYVFGGEGNDTLDGGQGDDWVNGGAGDDYVIDRDGDNRLSGDVGNDTLIGGAFDDTLLGGAGDDELSGGLSDDTLIGGSGNDTLYYWNGDDSLDGGDGDDVFIIDEQGLNEGYSRWGWSIVLGGLGTDFLETQFSLAGTDIRHVSGNQWQINRNDNDGSHVIIDVLDVETITFSSGETITLSTDAALDTSDAYVRSNPDDYMGDGSGNNGAGSYFVDGVRVSFAGNDTLGGSNSANDLNGSTGHDLIYGFDGADTIYGMSGNDSISGGDGDDTLNGFSGADLIEGGAGNDTLDGLSGSDILFGEEGNDLLIGQSGSDFLSGGLDADTLMGGEGSDTLVGDEGNDELHGGSGSDNLNGGEGNDHLHGWYGHDVLLGEAGDDSIFGGGGYDSLVGGAGDDSMSGGSEDDILSGGEGADTLDGGDGFDILSGGEGADSIDGGGGILDLVEYATSDAAITVNLSTATASGGHAGGDTLINVEGVFGSVFADMITGNGEDNTLAGNDGQDTLSGGSGHDNLDGERGSDVIYGGDGFDRLWGGLNDDSLFGEDGDDTLYGGAGDDTLYGDSGNDLLIGDALEAHYSAEDTPIVLPTMTLGSSDLVSLTYIASHTDLISSLGADAQAGREHFNSTGADAGLTITFDALSYLASHDDLIMLYGFDLEAATQHYIEIGAGENRVIDFDALQYARNYEEVRDAYGNDQADLARHYIAEGHTEGLVWASATADALNETQWDAFLAAGGSFEDVIFGGAGDDTIEGRDGNDNLYGDDGSDLIEGGLGHDAIFGGGQSDTIDAGAGNDTVQSGMGRDMVTLGEGDDIFHGDGHHDTWGRDEVRGGAGDDTFFFHGSEDIATGGAGDDTFVFSSVLAAADTSITDFGTDMDVLQFHGITESDLTTAIVGSDTLITWANGSVSLEGVDQTNLTSDHFEFL